jgi:tripartite-type tricarboxylate transporter receptor subunit TctC
MILTQYTKSNPETPHEEARCRRPCGHFCRLPGRFRRDAAAQAYPAKPIRWIVPYAAGGGSDFLARTVAQTLSTQVGQPVLVDNKPGGNTALAAAETARAPADGYTILSADNGTLVFNPALYKSLSYSPTKDLAPVTLMGKFPMILVVGTNWASPRAKDFIAKAQGQARRHQLRLGRRGQPAPPGDGAAEGRGRPVHGRTCRTAARRRRWPTWSAASCRP